MIIEMYKNIQFGDGNIDQVKHELFPMRVDLDNINSTVQLLFDMIALKNQIQDKMWNNLNDNDHDR